MPRGAPALPSATGPPAGVRARHVRPVLQYRVVPVNERAPTPNFASGASKGALSGTKFSVPGNQACSIPGKASGQYVEALAPAAAVSRSFSSKESSTSYDACRSPSSREEAPYVREHAHSRSNLRTTIIGSSSRQAQKQ